MPKVTKWQGPGLNSGLSGPKAYTAGFMESMEHKPEEWDIVVLVKGIPGQGPTARLAMVRGKGVSLAGGGVGGGHGTDHQGAGWVQGEDSQQGA